MVSDTVNARNLLLVLRLSTQNKTVQTSRPSINPPALLLWLEPPGPRTVDARPYRAA